MSKKYCYQSSAPPFSFGGGYYQVRWPAKLAEDYNHDRKYPLSEWHIRFMGWMSLPMELVFLYAAVVWIIEDLLNADFYISGAVLLVLLLAIAIGVCTFLRKRRSSKPVFKDREEWVKSYLKQHPEAPPLQIIGAYNSHRELGDQWGYFSLREMERLVAKIKSDQV
jgi:hypothetical protein